MKVDDRNIFKEYKKYKHKKQTIENNKQEFDFIDYLKTLKFDNFIKMEIKFESWQDTDILPIDIPDILYHVCRTIDKDKIFKSGLIPKSKSKISFHPDRIYLSLDKENCSDLIKQFKIIEDIDYSIIEINSSELKYLKLKRDPNYVDAYYTNQNISYNYIYEKGKIKFPTIIKNMDIKINISNK